MKKWEQFEIDCVEYLNKTYGKYLFFEHNGGSDSTTSDIKVLKKDLEQYYIEVKHTPAQCCQFVLFPEDNKFVYSDNNKKPTNQYITKIINYMNNNFEYFSNKIPKAKPIIYNNCQEDFFNCVKEFYSYKNVKYFITNNFQIIPIDDINYKFDISAVYRVKKSGSKSVSKSLVSEIIEYIKIKYPTINNIKYDDKNIIIKSNEDLNKQIFEYKDWKFMFSEKNNNYVIRQLSNTCNSNVIFSIKLSKNFENDFDFFNEIK